MTIWELLANQWQQQSIGEIFAVAFAIAYVWLAAEESIWCWPAGFISTALYAYVYWDVTLMFQMLLNLYYMTMAVYGFITWGRSGKQKVFITRMRWSEHTMTILVGLSISTLVYLFAKQFINYDLVLLDISITVFSLITTYLTVIKKLENWYYWSFINLSSVFLLYDKALYLSMLLMLIYICLAVRGLFHWFDVYRSRRQT